MERAGDILKDAFARSDPSRESRYLPLFRNWRAIAGPDLERHVTLKDFRNDTLIAETTHPGWRQIVSLRKDEILKRINALYPGLGIKDLRVQIVRKIEHPPAPSGAAKPFPEETNDESAGELEEVLEHMTDNDLKQALKKLYASRPRRKPSEKSPGDGD